MIQQLEQEEITRLAKNIPEFAPGETVIVNVNVVEGNRKRVQAYEGVVISRRNRGLNSNFIVRKISSGEGVERTFQLYSPLIASIEDMLDCMDVLRANRYHHPPSITGLQMEMIGWRKGREEREKLKTKKLRKPSTSRNKRKFFSSRVVEVGYGDSGVSIVAQGRGAFVRE